MKAEPTLAQTNPAAAARAADIVVRGIEQDIRGGILADGVTLPSERHLVDRFGVSRTVVREALRILSSRGLVETRPRYRPVVRAPGVDAALGAVEGIVSHMLAQPGGVKNLFDTRTLIEAALARNAALHAKREHIAALQEALDRNGAVISDSEAFFQTDIAFHRVLFDVTDNPALLAVHQAYTTWLAPHWSQMPRQDNRNSHNHAAHTAIFDGILRRDPDAAEEALRAHMADAWDQVCQTFTEL